MRRPKVRTVSTSGIATIASGANPIGLGRRVELDSPWGRRSRSAASAAGHAWQSAPYSKLRAGHAPAVSARRVLGRRGATAPAAG